MLMSGALLLSESAPAIGTLLARGVIRTNQEEPSPARHPQGHNASNRDQPLQPHQTQYTQGVRGSSAFVGPIVATHVSMGHGCSRSRL